jgi:hypothetical protein
MDSCALCSKPCAWSSSAREVARDAMMKFSELERDLAAREPSDALEQLEPLERFSAAVDEKRRKRS